MKFSELAVLDKDNQPFSNTYGSTSAAVLTEVLSLDDITYSSIDDLVAFVSAIKPVDRKLDEVRLFPFKLNLKFIPDKTSRLGNVLLRVDYFR